MNTTEAAALLAICAAYDNRKPDEIAAQAWAYALEGLRFEDCRDAIVTHYRASREWIMPADVVTGVRRVRAKRIAEAGDLTPPRGLTDAEEREWLGEARRRIGNGESVEVDHGALEARHLPDLRQLVKRVPDAPPEPDQAENRRRMEAARAELEPLRNQLAADPRATQAREAIEAMEESA